LLSKFCFDLLFFEIFASLIVSYSNI